MPKIIKIKHKAVKNSQIQIPDYVFDEGLTLDAIGLYIYLLGRKQKEVFKNACKSNNASLTCGGIRNVERS